MTASQENELQVKTAERIVTPPGFFFGKDGQLAPRDVIREPYGRIALAHAELMGYQMWEGAVHEGERAGKQAIAMK